MRNPWNRVLLAFLAICAGLFAGCGGVGGGAFFGQVSGIIFDLNGDVVRGARVTWGGNETFSNSSGMYVLDGVREGIQVVRAEIVQGGSTFNGQNITHIFRDERTRNLNITVVRTNQQAMIHGTVRDRFGNLVAGAHVFAYSGLFSSDMDITDGSGDYEIRRLGAGITYLVTASARTFNSDTGNVVLSAGEDRRVDFTLDDESNPTLPAPQNLGAVAWTTPFEATRAPSSRLALEAVKRIIDPRRALRPPPSRTSPLGNHVEVDLYWDPLPPQYYVSLLGFGIYRALSSGGSATAIDFLRDPNAVYFADVDDNLNSFTTYYYELTALNTSYPDFPNSESPPSNRYGVETLGDLVLNPITFGPTTFRWQSGSGADDYTVFVFDEYPGIGVDPLWVSSPTAGTTQVYGGPPLNSGQRYYFIVLGSANLGESLTLSEIGEFVAN